MAQRQIASDFKSEFQSDLFELLISDLQKEPVEGFLCVPDESNFFVWTIYIEGPKDTPLYVNRARILSDPPVKVVFLNYEWSSRRIILCHHLPSVSSQNFIIQMV